MEPALDGRVFLGTMTKRPSQMDAHQSLLANRRIDHQDRGNSAVISTGNNHRASVDSNHGVLDRIVADFLRQEAEKDETIRHLRLEVETISSALVARDQERDQLPNAKDDINDLHQLVDFYKASSERLSAQVLTLRKELDKLQTQVEEREHQIKDREAQLRVLERIDPESQCKFDFITFGDG
jgi:chromosome segregation ATPase